MTFFQSLSSLALNSTRYRWLIIFTFFYSISYTQSPSFKNYTTKDGLPSNTIYEIKIDKDNYLWIATNYGISKFDGHSFRTFNKKDGLTDNEIFGFFTDSKDRMWLRTFNGSLCYYKNGIFHKSNHQTRYQFDFQ